MFAEGYMPLTIAPSGEPGPCFGGPFLVWHPSKYAELLATRIRLHNTRVWLVNTGWSGGGYGVGKRIKLAYTRAVVDGIHNGALACAKTRGHAARAAASNVSSTGARVPSLASVFWRSTHSPYGSGLSIGSLVQAPASGNGHQKRHTVLVLMSIEPRRHPQVAIIFFLTFLFLNGSL